jgi:hypothetical protein
MLFDVKFRFAIDLVMAGAAGCKIPGNTIAKQRPPYLPNVLSLAYESNYDLSNILREPTVRVL